MNFVKKEKRLLPKQPDQKSQRYESASLQGSKMFNQDYIICSDGIWILCDGHGEYGHEISEFVSKIMF